MTESASQRPSQSASYAQSVTQWLGQLKQGDQLAAQKIWDRYVEQLIRRAAARMGRVRGGGDEEDVVIVAFENFFRRVKQGGFSKLEDRDDLWQILVMITDRRAIDHIRKESVGIPVAEGSILDSDNGNWLETVADVGPSPDFVALFNEELEANFDALANERLQKIALLKMDGYKNAEIAEQIGISLRSVERKLKRIRDIWQSEAGHER